MIQLSSGATTGIIVASVAVVIAVFIVLLFLVILPFIYKRQIHEIQKRYSYLDAKLIGQDSQYFHRLEIISRTNLLYADKYEYFSKQFKSILDNEDKYCESIIKQLNSLAKAKQFRRIKPVILEARKAVSSFEESVNTFDDDIYKIIKLEEDCRKCVDSLKETFRHLKQNYFTVSDSITLSAGTFAKTFAKIEDQFQKFDDDIESASYDEITEKLPQLKEVLNLLNKVISELPSLNILITVTLPEHIEETKNKFKETEKEGVPLYHINFETRVSNWEKRLNVLTTKLINLQINGIAAEYDLIENEINEVKKQLDDEVVCKNYFNDNYNLIYSKVNDIEKVFLKLTVNLPQIKSVYKFEGQDTRMNELSAQIDQLTNAKRFLEGFVYSGIKQPYSLLKKQLDELNDNYETIALGVNEFANYIDSLKATAEDAYQNVFVYYERLKETEKLLNDINIEEITNSYTEKLNAVYDVLNDIYELLQTRPIDVVVISNRVDQLKNVANAIFEEVDDKMRECSICESLLIKINNRRIDTDVNQRVETLENAFYKGEFRTVANQIESFKENSELL